MGNPEDQIEVIAGQIVAQNMLTHLLMTQFILLAADRGVALRQALEEGITVMERNPNMTDREKFGAVETLKDAVDTFDRAQAALSGV